MRRRCGVRRGVTDFGGLDGPIKAELTASCLSGGDEFRVLAVVCDVVLAYGQRPFLPADVPLVALALARYGMKTFLLTKVQLDSLAKHMRAGGCMHLPRGVLVMRRGPPGAPSLPLARSFSSGSRVPALYELGRLTGVDDGEEGEEDVEEDSELENMKN